MSFIKGIGLLELTLISGFGLLYFFYLIRVLIIAKKLKTSVYKVVFKLLLRSGYFVLLLIALLGPYIARQNKEKELKSVAKDIYIALDLSLSMNARDIPPSRLERVKFELNKVISAFSSDRIGLIIFSNNAFVQCPITYDKKSLALFLDVSSTNLIEQSGTDFAPPLEMALRKHMKNTESKESAKIILLVSDGEDFSEETEDIAEEIKDEKIKLFTLGVGTSKGANIPDGKGVKRDRNNQPVVTTLKRKPLIELAKLTGGQYFEISDKRNDTKKLINTISKIKGEVKDVKKVTDPKTLRYHYFLIPALLLMLIDFLIVNRIIKL